MNSVGTLNYGGSDKNIPLLLINRTLLLREGMVHVSFFVMNIASRLVRSGETSTKKQMTKFSSLNE